MNISSFAKSLFPKPYSCAFSSSENLKSSEIQGAAITAIRELDLPSLEKLSNCDLNFRNKDGNTLLHLLVLALLRNFSPRDDDISI